jgi:tryptophan synthase alpha chain
MGRIGERFTALRGRGERALVPFLTAGDPDLDATEALVLALADAGADLIELGVPFSDPIADGPVIQRAYARALARGTTLRRILDLVKRLRPRVAIPLLLMGSANPFYVMRDFVAAAAEVGVDGLIVPDLPPEEGEALYADAASHGIDPVLLAAPTTTDARLEMLVARTRGFLYYVSLTGVTGARTQLASGIEEGVARVRRLSEVPVCVGFGVSKPEHAREIGRFADGVVVGSALVARIESAKSPEDAVDAAARLVAELKAPLRP